MKETQGGNFAEQESSKARWSPPLRVVKMVERVQLSLFLPLSSYLSLSQARWHEREQIKDTRNLVEKSHFHVRAPKPARQKRANGGMAKLRALSRGL